MTHDLDRRGFLAVTGAAGVGATPGGAPSATAAPPSTGPSGGPVLAITGTTVIDPATGRRQHDATVLVRGNRIADVGPSWRVAVPRDAQVLDGRGRYVIPGLMDAHVHSFGLEAIDLPLFLADGVTTVREMNGGNPGMFERRQRIAAGELFGPQYTVASSLFDGVPSLLAGISTVVPVADPDQARAAVHEALAGGADLIEVHTRLDRASLAAIADETRRLGVHFAGRTTDATSLVEAADLGQRSFEHVYDAWCRPSPCPTAASTAGPTSRTPSRCWPRGPSTRDGPRTSSTA